MELSSETVGLLNNFSNINPNLVVEAGNTIMTVSESNSLVAIATVQETFDQGFGIYDLGEFLRAVDLVDTPQLNFTDNFVTIADQSNRTNIKYFYSSPDILTTIKKEIKMPSAEVKFTIDSGTLNKLLKAASVFSHEVIHIAPVDGVLRLSVRDPDNETANQYSIDVAGEFDEGAQFEFVINIGNLRLIPGAYNVIISSKNIAQFDHEEKPLKYWVALEKRSKYSS